MTHVKKDQERDIVAQIHAIETDCGYADPYATAERRTQEGLLRRVPAAIVERVLALAVRHDGVVAGIKFDPVQAKRDLERADTAEAIADAARSLARRADDEAIRLRLSVAQPAGAIATALRTFAKTAQGGAFRQVVDELAAIRRRARRGSKKVPPAPNGGGSEVTTPTPATEGHA